MSKKTTTKTDQTVTPINPTQVTNGLTGFADKITGLQNTDPYSFTTGANPLQTQAGGLAGTIGMYDNEAGATMNSDYDKAMATASSLGTMGSGPGARALSYMNDYMNPYTDSVVNTSLADFDKNAGRQQAQATLDAAQDTSWGGSGYGIAKSLLTRELNDGRASLDSGLRSQGFTTALGAGQADARTRCSSARSPSRLRLRPPRCRRRLRLGGSATRWTSMPTIAPTSARRCRLATTCGRSIFNTASHHSRAPPRFPACGARRRST
jgi:hypothetical protein